MLIHLKPSITAEVTLFDEKGVQIELPSGIGHITIEPAFYHATGSAELLSGKVQGTQSGLLDTFALVVSGYNGKVTRKNSFVRSTVLPRADRVIPQPGESAPDEEDEGALPTSTPVVNVP